MHWSQNYSHKKVGFLKKKFFWTPCRYHLAFSEYFGWTVCYRLSHLVPLKIKMGCMTSYLLVAHWCQKRPFLGQKIQKKNLKSPAYDEIVTWKKKKKIFNINMTIAHLILELALWNSKKGKLWPRLMRRVKKTVMRWNPTIRWSTVRWGKSGSWV